MFPATLHARDTPQFCYPARTSAVLLMGVFSEGLALLSMSPGWWQDVPHRALLGARLLGCDEMSPHVASGRWFSLTLGLPILQDGVSVGAPLPCEGPSSEKPMKPKCPPSEVHVMSSGVSIPRGNPCKGLEVFWWDCCWLQWKLWKSNHRPCCSKVGTILGVSIINSPFPSSQLDLGSA